ncbi:amidohydrolase [Actinomycetota bacterium]
MTIHATTLAADLGSVVEAHLPELLALRRDIHAHPETAWEETRTSALVAERLRAAGADPRPIRGTGLVLDIGAERPAQRVLLRADMDALPVRERTGLDWQSTVPGVSHACGHDVHTAGLLGAGLALLEHEEALRATGFAARLVFQPAEEVQPGGGEALVDEGVLEGVHAAYALHCDPGLDVGQVGMREGPITAASDGVRVTLRGRGGHTSRPHMTEDLVFALAKVATEVPAALSRRLDPRAGAALVWGHIEAGKVANVIPSSGTVVGTLRILDASVWDQIGPLLEEIVEGVVAPYAVSARLEHVRGVPPVVCSPVGVSGLRTAVLSAGLLPAPTPQSMGGEDFSFYLRGVEGAMGRLGTRSPGGRTYDLHQGDLVIDEAAVGIAARVLAGAAVAKVTAG